eukprot:Selendium_serpulae@DN1626_c0_g2_i2.p1
MTSLLWASRRITAVPLPLSDPSLLHRFQHEMPGGGECQLEVELLPPLTPLVGAGFEVAVEVGVVVVVVVVAAARLSHRHQRLSALGPLTPSVLGMRDRQRATHVAKLSSTAWTAFPLRVGPT